MLMSSDKKWVDGVDFAAHERQAEQSPQLSSDDCGSFHPPKAVKVIYKGATYTGMVLGLVLALPFMTVASAKKWYEKSKGEKDNE
jgi:hypothetical protein